MSFLEEIVEKVPSPKKPTKHDWPKISLDYIEGTISAEGERIYPTLEDIASKYNIRQGMVRKHAAKEHWRDKRGTFQEELAEKEHQIRLARRAREELIFHDNCLKLAKGGIFHLSDHMQQLLDRYNSEKKSRAAKSEKEKKAGAKPSDKEKLADILDADSLRMLDGISRALERFQRIGCIALGIPESRSSTALTGKDDGPIQIQTDLGDMGDQAKQMIVKFLQETSGAEERPKLEDLLKEDFRPAIISQLEEKKNLSEGSPKAE